MLKAQQNVFLDQVSINWTRENSVIRVNIEKKLLDGRSDCVVLTKIKQLTVLPNYSWRVWQRGPFHLWMHYIQNISALD